MMSVRAKLLAIAGLMALASCASSPMRDLGTGDVSFRLVWSGKSDLDIHVYDPQRQLLSHHRRRSPTGGVLDIDCNADSICADPVENVYWPLGQAPSGRYRVWATVHRFEYGELAVKASLLILRGDAVVERYEAVLTGKQDVLGPHSYVFPGGGDSADTAARGSESPAVGNWLCTTERPIGGLAHVLTLGSDLEGTIMITEPAELALTVSDGVLEGRSLSFNVSGSDAGLDLALRFQGMLDSEVIKGDYFPRSGDQVPTVCVRE